jgi:hypothetical protein
MAPIRISGKNLGELAMPDFCPRCFWIKNTLKLPYQIFPGIFISIDSYAKAVTEGYYAKYGRVPPWLAPLGNLGAPVKPPSHQQFKIVDPTTGITLTGAPDAVFRAADGSYFIGDYKTAKYTGAQDALMPIYEVQLNAYAYIAERTGYSPVTGLALIYYEPVTALPGSAVDQRVWGDGFAMHFTPNLHPITLDAAMIPPLLERARDILGSEFPPGGEPECKDCQRLDELAGVVGVGGSSDETPG